MTIAKNKAKNNFTIIPNEIITDERLSKGSLQVYLYVSSKPNNWKIHNNEIKKSLKIGSANTLAKYWKELIESGWISRIKETDKRGQFTGSYNYTINTEIAKSDTSEEPKSQKNRNRNNTEFGKSANYNNTKSINNTNKDKEDKNFLFFKEIIKKYKEPQKLKDTTIEKLYPSFKVKFNKCLKNVGNYDTLKKQIENYLECLKIETWRKKCEFSVFINQPEKYLNNWKNEKTEALKRQPKQKNQEIDYKQQAKIQEENEKWEREMKIKESKNDK